MRWSPQGSTPKKEKLVVIEFTRVNDAKDEIPTEKE
jgi:hypothetical protein